MDKSLNFDPYETLGVKYGASMDDIKKAFRRKMLNSHPDLGNSATSEEITKIKDAYEQIKKISNEKGFNSGLSGFEVEGIELYTKLCKANFGKVIDPGGRLKDDDHFWKPKYQADYDMDTVAEVMREHARESGTIHLADLKDFSGLGKWWKELPPCKYETVDITQWQPKLIIPMALWRKFDCLKIALKSAMSSVPSYCYPPEPLDISFDDIDAIRQRLAENDLKLGHLKFYRTLHGFYKHKKIKSKPLEIGVAGILTKTD
ncbi:MAG: J domain-containing protein [Christensenellaceae bacterium]|jgi:hypothetical protein|nr:J domain-containing protein [Christensenellaceae bacterium]